MLANRAIVPPPIIMTTASSERQFEVECLKRGADDFVRKPFNNDVLMSRVQNALRRASVR
ncbi:MAG: response regulator [Actinomycetota bacterium]